MISFFCLNLYTKLYDYNNNVDEQKIYKNQANSGETFRANDLSAWENGWNIKSYNILSKVRRICSATKSSKLDRTFSLWTRIQSALQPIGRCECDERKIGIKESDPLRCAPGVKIVYFISSKHDYIHLQSTLQRQNHLFLIQALE